MQPHCGRYSCDAATPSGSTSATPPQGGKLSTPHLLGISPCTVNQNWRWTKAIENLHTWTRQQWYLFKVVACLRVTWRIMWHVTRHNNIAWRCLRHINRETHGVTYIKRPTYKKRSTNSIKIPCQLLLALVQRNKWLKFSWNWDHSGDWPFYNLSRVIIRVKWRVIVRQVI